MLDHLEVTDYAASQALQAGLQPDTDQYRTAVRSNFAQAMKHIQARAQTEVPEPFRPSPPPPPQPRAETRAAMISAPISRQAPSSNGERYELTPSKINLTADEKAIADASGLSHVEYARQKLRLLKAKKEGTIQP